MLPDLGRYALPVLLAYGTSLTLIAVLILVSLRQSIRTRAALRRIEAAQQKDEPNA